MAVHYNRSSSLVEELRLPDNPFIGLLAQTNAKVEEFDVSPDGKQIAYVSAEKGGYDLWVVNIDGSNNRRIVDMYNTQCLRPVWSPDGRWIAFQSRYSGPTGNIFKVRADGSESPINLTLDVGVGGSEVLCWTPDGKRLLFTRGGPTGYTQIASISAELPTGKVHFNYITADDFNSTEHELSPDGKWVAFESDRSGFTDRKRMDIWIVPIEGGYARNMTPNTKEHLDSKPRWSPDGKRLAFVSNRTGWRNIGVIDVETGKTTMLTHNPWEESYPQWSPDGKWIAYVACHNWNFQIMKVAADGSGEPIQLTSDDGVHGGLEGFQLRGSIRWTPDSKHIVYTFMDHYRCNDLWAISAQGGQPHQITNHMPKGLADFPFVKPELIRYKSKDGLEVPAFLYRPLNAKGRTPLLIYARSYIVSCHVNGFYPVIQYFVHKGYTVVAPHVRGSFGLGKKYEDLIFGDWGGGPIDDLVAAAEHLVAQGLVDRDKVVMQGGSTGGYFTLQTITRYPDLLKAAVCFYGPADLVAMDHMGGGASRPVLGHAVGGDFGGPDMARDHWVEQSPFYHVDRVKTPLMIMCGDRDTGQMTLANDYFRVLKEKGKLAVYILYNGEPHGWYDWRPETLEDTIGRLAAFYAKFIKV